jgi:hypothetical protein
MFDRGSTTSRTVTLTRNFLRFYIAQAAVGAAVGFLIPIIQAIFH